ncbi:MAG: GLPGLI family protein [Paludibacteraceae bacterium]
MIRRKFLIIIVRKRPVPSEAEITRAWFTPEIPIKEGPYKFSSLPGLILKISDDKNHYIFTCTGIRKPKSVVPIKFFKWEYKDITRERLNAYLVKVHNNQAQFFVTATGLRAYEGDKDVTTEKCQIYFLIIRLSLE